MNFVQCANYSRELSPPRAGSCDRRHIGKDEVGLFINIGRADSLGPAREANCEANMRKAESAILHLALNITLIVALVAISIPVAAAQIIFAPKLLKVSVGSTDSGGEAIHGIQ